MLHPSDPARSRPRPPDLLYVTEAPRPDDFPVPLPVFSTATGTGTGKPIKFRDR